MTMSSTCGAGGASTCATTGRPCRSCKPLSRRPCAVRVRLPKRCRSRHACADFTSKLRTMNDNRWLAPYINIGHFLDHLAMLIFPTVVLALARDWDRSYSELLPLTLGGFIAFGAFALPAGWLADHWSRYRIMLVFFFGLCAP